MTIDPFNPSSVSGRRNGEMFVSMRARMDDLQRQLATGRKADTFAGLGVDRRVSLSMRAKMGTLEGWTKAIGQADLRITFMMQTVEGFAKQTSEARSDARPGGYVVGADGQVTGQILARNRMAQAIDMLNVEVGGRYLFSGRSHDVKPVASFDEIMKPVGAPGPAGVRTLISERQQADAGVGDLGRLTNTRAGTTITLAREAANPPYGYTIASATSSSAAITATFAAGPPAGATLDVAANPAPGARVSLTLSLPDGTTEEITLEARASNAGQPSETGFAIGATPADTAQNLEASITAALQKTTRTALSAASAVIAARDFFAGSATNEPLRVPGPGFATATVAPAAGLPGQTLIWYRGDDTAAIQARNTATVQVDDGQTVAQGARANEQAFREGMVAFAVFASATFSAADANSRDRYEEVAERVRGTLGFPGAQKPQDIAVEISAAQVTMKDARERHSIARNFLDAARADIEDANDEEVAASILALQTRMQASYQTTSILSRLSLVNFIN